MGTSFMDPADVFDAEFSEEEVDGGVAVSHSYRYGFTIARPLAVTWPVLKDFSLWMEDLAWTSVVGDAQEGSTIDFTIAPAHHDRYRRQYGFDPAVWQKVLVVERTVPGRLIVHKELSPNRREITAVYTTAVHEEDGHTIVTGLMTYGPMWASQEDADELRALVRGQDEEVAQRWKTTYIPRLRDLVESATRA
jgi:hypothetical protein